MNDIDRRIRERINAEAKARQIVHAPPMQHDDGPKESRLPYGLLLIAVLCAAFWAGVTWLAG